MTQAVALTGLTSEQVAERLVALAVTGGSSPCSSILPLYMVISRAAGKLIYAQGLVNVSRFGIRHSAHPDTA